MTDKQAFGSSAADKGSDFVDAISQAAKADRVYEEIPPTFPTASMPADKPIDHIEQERANNALNPENFEAHYGRFDMADMEEVEQLEEINNHVLRDGWVMAREEWVHTKEGSSFVIVKYLIAKNKPGKART